MKLGVREKLFLVSVLLILIVGVTVGAYLENALQAWTESRIEAELQRHARSVRELVEQQTSQAIETMDPIADRLGDVTSARVTVVTRDGAVIGDSQLSRDDLAWIENHAGRPEIRAAMAEGRGVSRRYSTTVGTQMLYVAVPFGGEPPLGTVRVAMPLTEVDRIIGELRFLLAIGAVLGLVTAVFMSGLASHLMTRTLRALLRHARAVSGRTTQDPRGKGDEIAGLAGTFSRLESELEYQMSALARERDRSEAILECMSEGLFALDERQRITLVNGAALSLLQRGESPLGQRLPELTGAPSLERLVSSAMAGRPASVEIALAASTPVQIMAHATPQRGGGAVVVMHDITDIRRLESVRRDFIANASHELRTPVSIIRANAETLLDGAAEDPEAGRSLVQALERNARRLGSLVADLLDLSRLDAGQYQLELEPLALREAAVPVLDSMGRTRSEKDIRITNELYEDTRVVADRKALEQVLLNLLDNAIKYTPAGGWVAIRDVPLNGLVRLEVEDNGPGIGVEHRPRLFERFYRVDPGRSRHMGGTGLGLAIVKSLVEAMGGRVGMEPASPHGAVFWVTLRSGSSAAEAEGGA